MYSSLCWQHFHCLDGMCTYSNHGFYNVYRKRTYYWKKPMTRTYHYNLNVGENYYTPMTAYLESLDRGAREQSPGALTFDERLYRDWQRGHRYGEYGSKSRASSLTRYEAGSGGSTYVDRWARASTLGTFEWLFKFTVPNKCRFSCIWNTILKKVHVSNK